MSASSIVQLVCCSTIRCRECGAKGLRSASCAIARGSSGPAKDLPNAVMGGLATSDNCPAWSLNFALSRGFAALTIRPNQRNFHAMLIVTNTAAILLKAAKAAEGASHRAGIRLWRGGIRHQPQ